MINFISRLARSACHATAIAAAAFALLGAPAMAATYNFSLSTALGSRISFTLADDVQQTWTHPLFGFSAAQTDVLYFAPGAGTGAATTAAFIFYSAMGGGGVNIASPHNSGPYFVFDVAGPQLYSGPSSSPAFLPGTYAMSLTESGVATSGQLLVSAVAPVPEPAEWALLLSGIGLVGFVARARRQGSVACA